MTIAIKKFYKVLVISIDLFESKIVDEKHFPSSDLAQAFISSLDNTEYVTVMVEVQSNEQVQYSRFYNRQF